MSESIVQEIADKTAALPLELQHEVLEFVEFKLQRIGQVGRSKRPFRSVRGILHNKLEHLDEDLAEVRREMWQNFPREDPK
jgi:hypothetical protein